MDIDKFYKYILRLESQRNLNATKGIFPIAGTAGHNLIFARIKNNLAKLKLNLNTAIKKDVEADIALLATIGLISISESDKLVDFINE